ncbi:glycosyltransferase family 4 protein [Vitellibacter sp. q18]|nr:glycosyltransferase family 4 protein [Aequorivita lutea]
MKRRILQIGPYSAVGGVSIHIKRLSSLLKEHHNFTFIDESPRTNDTAEVFNLRSKNFLKYFKLLNKAEIIHIHTGILWLQCLHIFLAYILRKKVIVTIHSLSNLNNKFSIRISEKFLALASKTIFVSDEISRKFNLKNKVVIHAFIPPDTAVEEELPKEVLNILEKNKDKRIIVNNAFKLVLYNKQDLYGLDLLLDVARFIKRDHKNYKIIFVVASMDEKLNLYDQYVQIIKDENLEEQISLIPYPISFVKLMMSSDLVVRATNTDGDALTVREALFLKKPIIASDVTLRPEGTILFTNRDSQDLYLKINAVLDKNIQTKGTVLNNTKSFYLNRFSDIY